MREIKKIKSILASYKKELMLTSQKINSRYV